MADGGYEIPPFELDEVIAWERTSPQSESLPYKFTVSSKDRPYTQPVHSTGAQCQDFSTIGRG